MHYAALFRGGQRARSLLITSSANASGIGPRAALWLEWFRPRKLHHIEAFAVLFTVMTDPRDVWMMNLRSGAASRKKRDGHRQFAQLSDQSLSARL